MAAITREGYLFEWNIPAPACQSEWPVFRHDNQNTGNYNADGTAPAAPTGVTLKRLGGGRYHLTFTSPGDDRMCGTAASYRTLVDGKPVNLSLGAPVAGGKTVEKDVKLPAGAGVLSIQAVDDGKPNTPPKDNVNPGNRGEPTTVRVPAKAPKAPCGGFEPTSTIQKQALAASRTQIRASGLATGAQCVHGKAVPHRARTVLVSLARVGSGNCRYLRADGKLGKVVACAIRGFLTAQLDPGVGKGGSTRWTFKRQVQLPPGTYVLWSRAVGEKKGLVERLSTSAGTAALTIR
jgi:hypothetical protein